MGVRAATAADRERWARESVEPANCYQSAKTARLAASILAKDTRIKSGAKRTGIRSPAVESENVESARYDPDTLELEIRFSSSPEVQVFRNIPITVYKSLMTAKSVGAYFAEHVKNHYPFTRKAK